MTSNKPIPITALNDPLLTMPARERQAWHLLALGHSNEEIAAALTMNYGAARQLVGMVYARLGLDHKPNARVLATLRYCMRYGVPDEARRA